MIIIENIDPYSTRVLHGFSIDTGKIVNFAFMRLHTKSALG